MERLSHGTGVFVGSRSFLADKTLPHYVGVGDTVSSTFEPRDNTQN